VTEGAWLDGDVAIVRRDHREQRIRLDGAGALIQQADNLLAALLALACLDADLEAAVGALAAFEGLPHRCELVAEIAGVRFVDDSKATNVGAAERSLAALPGPIIWIAGGRHKGGELAPLAATAARRVRCALLIGEAAATFEDALAETVPCEVVGQLAKAVVRAAELAQPGDLVLLAPACASFDQFQSFEDRGRQFQAAVAALAAAQHAGGNA
jgi:UDP-N-acetylmuramoylalanine--D-glutamate ligase